MIECKRPGCDRPVPQKGVGRPAEYHSDACRAADRRDRELRSLVVEVADLIGAAPDSVLCRALAGLNPSALTSLRDGLAAQQRAS